MKPFSYLDVSGNHHRWFSRNISVCRPICNAGRRISILSAIYSRGVNLILFGFCALCIGVYPQRGYSQEQGARRGDQSVIVGTVRSFSTNSPLEGATVNIGETRIKTDSQGKFSFRRLREFNAITVSHLGYKDTTILLPARKNQMDVLLIPADHQIEEVEVLSTGYQRIPKERATGSFAYVDASTLERNPGIGILSRLNGVTNGLLIDRGTGNPDGISVRGRTTIFSSTRPLIVVDNFPYEGDLDNINPNDIESVTVLKDATAASIWGVRSGNGVIVITTKRARDVTAVEYSTNFLVRKKPDLFTEKMMTSSDFIDSEIWLYEQGYYNSDINIPYQGISPIIAILERIKLNEITINEGERQIQEYRKHDVRHDLENYFYRNFFQQQHHANISSSGKNVRNILSLGYDKTISDNVGSDNNRLHIRNANQWSVSSERIRLESEIWYTQNNSNNANSLGYSPRYPYEYLADRNGNALEATKLNTLRRSYTDTVGSGHLLDWKYRPLDEIQNSLSKSEWKDQQLRFQLALESKLYRTFRVKASYLNSYNWVNNSVLYDQQSFYTRDLINRFTEIDLTNNSVIRPIPLGDILKRTTTRGQSQYGRIQLDWNESIDAIHAITGTMGIEWRQDRVMYEDYGLLYGYDRDLESFSAVDVFTYFPIYHTGTYARIGTTGSRSRQVDNNRSIFGVVSYTYDDNLTLNGSFRKDASNIFGVHANQKGVPLWSAGLAYSFQQFLDVDKLDLLKMRLTYGYNGNVDKNTTAFLTSKLFRNTNLWGKPMDVILNPPNNSLRWERVQNMNIGIDFNIMNNRLSGSIEYFIKNGKDLMGRSPLAPQTGMVEFYGNVASTSTRGVDLQLRSMWIDNKEYQFGTDLIFNAAKDRVTDYYIEPGTNTDIVTAFDIVPMVGYPINALTLYRSKGLNENGDPLGLLDNQETTDYLSIINGTDRRSIVTLGSMVPTRFGSLRNTFSFKSFEISFQILYKWGHYLRQENSFNSDGLIDGAYRFADYEDRWQSAGDEKRTNVPAFVYPHDINRQEFYQRSDVLAIRGGMARLQDLRLSYTLHPFRNNSGSAVQFYLYASNLGLLWRQNGKGLDPEYLSGYKLPSEWSFGFKFKY